MLFLLATPEYNNVQENTTKVKVHLRNGVAEIFDQHQDLMGKVDNNLIEIETNFENKFEKFLFVLQDAVFIVSNQGLEGSIEQKGTGIYVYAKRVREISGNMSIDDVKKQLEQKQIDLNTEIEKLSGAEVDPMDKLINSRILILKEDVEFLNKVVTIVSDLKA
jgi:F0F1-type ATP synthase epsilon subunit